MAHAANTRRAPCPASPNIRENRNGNDTMAYGAETDKNWTTVYCSDNTILQTVQKYIQARVDLSLCSQPTSDLIRENTQCA